MDLFSLSCGVYKCNFGLCRRTCLTFTDAISHSKTHNINGKYHCEECLFYSTNKSSSFKKHQQVHSQNRPFICTLCKYRTSNADHFDKHKGKHLINNKIPTKIPTKRGRPVVKKFDCQYDNCEYHGLDREDLGNHVKSHINPPLQSNMMKILAAVAAEDESLSSTIDIITAEIVKEYKTGFDRSRKRTTNYYDSDDSDDSDDNKRRTIDDSDYVD